MADEFLDLLTETPLETLFLLLSLSVLRMAGFLYGFVPIYWGIGPSVLLRASIAMALVLPVAAANLGSVAELAETADTLTMALLTPKEFALGLGLGVLASTPFAAAQYAGAITDTFRGESDSGIPNPTGGQIQTFALLYMIIVMAALFGLDIFAALMGLIYKSYTIWEVTEFLPEFSVDTGLLAGEFLSTSLFLGALLAMPLFIVLAIAEATVSIGARLGRRMGLYELAFPVKNLLTILLAPVVSYTVLKFAPSLLDVSSEALDKLIRLFG